MPADLADRVERAEQIWPDGWEEDCKRWRGSLLTGKYGHWCNAWDGLPIDETCPEWPCECADVLVAAALHAMSGRS